MNYFDNGNILRILFFNLIYLFRTGCYPADELVKFQRNGVANHSANLQKVQE